jgi:hypothetical protein
LVFWSSFRMVSAAMSSMIGLLASDAKRRLGATTEIYASARGATYFSPARLP